MLPTKIKAQFAHLHKWATSVVTCAFVFVEVCVKKKKKVTTVSLHVSLSPSLVSPDLRSRHLEMQMAAVELLAVGGVHAAEVRSERVESRRGAIKLRRPRLLLLRAPVQTPRGEEERGHGREDREVRVAAPHLTRQGRLETFSG